MEVLECQLFSRRKNQEIECLAITPDGYFCAVAQIEGYVTIFDTITFHSCLCISNNENYSLRNLFFVKKDISNFQKRGSFSNTNNLTFQEYTSDTESDGSGTTACTSPSKSPFRKSCSLTGAASSKVFDLYTYRLIGLGLDGRIIEWDLSTGLILNTMFSYGGAIFQGALSPSGDELALACADGSVKIFNLLENMISYSYSLPKHTSRLLSVTYLNKNTIFSGSSDGVILEYNLQSRICKNRMSVRTGKKLDKFHSKKISIWCLICIEFDNILFSGDSNGTVIVWDLITFTAISTFKNHQGDVLTLSKFGDILFEDSNLYIVSTGMDGRLVSYIRTENNSRLEQLTKWLPGSFCYPHNSYIKSISTASSPHFNGPLALSATWDGKLALWLSIEQSLRLKEKSRNSNTISRHKYIVLPDGILNISSDLQVAENERLILHQNLNSLELWFISDPNIKRNVEKNSDNLFISPFQITYKKLNNIRSTYLGDEKNASANLVPVQPIKLLELKLSDKKSENISCCALSNDGNYIVGSFTESGIRAAHIDLETLNVNNILLESCNNILATCMSFLNNNILVIGGYYLLNDIKSNLSPNIWILDIERDIIVSSIILKSSSENKGLLGRVSNLNISPDNQWLAVVTNCGNAFIICLDSLKIEADLTNLERDILKVYRTGYYTPIISVCFNPYKKDVVSVVMSDGRYYFYSITLKRILPRKHVLEQEPYKQDIVDMPLINYISKKIYSPLLHGPIIKTNWISLPIHISNEKKDLIERNQFFVIQTYSYICCFNLFDEFHNESEDIEKLVELNINNTNEIEKEICGPVYKLPRFKKLEVFSESYLLFPERSFQKIDKKAFFEANNFSIHDGFGKKDLIRKESTDIISLSDKSVFGTFWVKSMKWLSLIGNNLSLEQMEISNIIKEGFLIVLSGKTNQNTVTKTNSRSNKSSINRKRYGE